MQNTDRDNPRLAALAYAARGWHVFPCHSARAGRCSCGAPACQHAGKHPRTLHGLKDATTDPALITRWWQQWPDANVAVATGAVSGLVALDEDPRHGGDVSLDLLTHEHGPLPETVEALTGGGGRHLLFLHPGVPLKSGTDRLGPGLDVKADGGYIIAAPSMHPSGQLYEWGATHDPEDVPIAPPPSGFWRSCENLREPMAKPVTPKAHLSAKGSAMPLSPV